MTDAPTSSTRLRRARRERGQNRMDRERERMLRRREREQREREQLQTKEGAQHADIPRT
jgi:hypothetical protein